MLQIYSHRFIDYLVKPDPDFHFSRAGWSYIKLHFLAAFADESKTNTAFLRACTDDTDRSIIRYEAEIPYDDDAEIVRPRVIKKSRRKKQDEKVRLKPLSFKQLSWPKLFNPFKWIEFFVGLLLQGLSAAFYFCCLAIRWFPVFMIVGMISLQNEGGEGFKVNRRLKVLNTFFGVIFGTLHFIFYLAMDLVMLGVNSVLSPWNSLIKPLFNFFRKSNDYTSLFMVLLSTALSALLITSVVCLFSGIPQFLMLLTPILTPIIQLITPAMFFLATHMGILLTQITCGLMIPLVILPLMQRIFDKDTYYNLGIHYMNAYGFVRDILFLIYPDKDAEASTGVGKKISGPDDEADESSEKSLLRMTHAEAKTVDELNKSWANDKSFVRVLCSTHVLAKRTDISHISQSMEQKAFS